MRAGIEELNPVQLANAACGCEVWEIDAGDNRATVCFHDENCKPVLLRKKVGKELRRVVRK